MRDHVKTLLDETVYKIYYHGWLPFSFPADPLALIEKIYSCKYISYQRLAEIRNLKVSEIAEILKNKDGGTYYQRKTGRYLITVNEDGRSPARVRWTTAHEIGHLAAGHFQEIDADILPPNALMEEEADYFAASFLAPFFAIQKMHIRNAADVRDIFGLSQTAAQYRWMEYLQDRYDRYAPRFRCTRPVDIWPEENGMWYT